MDVSEVMHVYTARERDTTDDVIIPSDAIRGTAQCCSRGHSRSQYRDYQAGPSIRIVVVKFECLHADRVSMIKPNRPSIDTLLHVQ